MRPVEHIRKSVFRLSQHAFAEVAGVSQATVSRWENGEFEPNRDELQRIRDAARDNGITWDDRWFFESPPVEAS